MNFFWKIYFWIEIALSLLFFWIWVHQPIPETLLFHRVRSWIMLAGIFGLAYDRRIGRAAIWKGVFIICLLLSLHSVITAGGPALYGSASSAAAIFFIFEIFRYWGLALYAFRSKPLWEGR